MTDKKTEEIKNSISEIIYEEIAISRYTPKEGEKFSDKSSFLVEIPKSFIDALEEEIQM